MRRFSERMNVCVEAAPNQAREQLLKPTNIRWNSSNYIMSNMRKLVASSVSRCELMLAAAAAARDKATGAHSFRMSAGRCGATERTGGSRGEFRFNRAVESQTPRHL